MSQKAGIDTPNFFPTTPPNDFYINMCYNVYAGSHQCKQYLRQSNSESSEEFAARKEVLTVNQTFSNGVQSIIDIIFRKDVSLSDKINEKIRQYYWYADGIQNINEVSKEILKHMLLANRVYALVWTPQFEGDLTVKEQEDNNIRPFIQIIDRRRVKFINRDSNGSILSIAIKGYYEERGRYGSETYEEYRVYFNDGAVELWRSDKNNKFALQETVQNGYRALPIIEFILDDNESDMPPFTDEAAYQLSHMNIESSRKSYNRKLLSPFVTTFGMLQNSQNIATNSVDENGNTIKKVEFHASKGIDFPVNSETGAKLGGVEIIELKGSADAIARNTLEDDLTSIKQGFVQFITSTSGNKTVTESENERAAGESKLSSLASTLRDGMNALHDLFCNMAGQKPEGEITVNTEFLNTVMTQDTYNMLSDLLDRQLISRDTYLQELQRQGMLPQVDIIEEMKKTEVGA